MNEELRALSDQIQELIRINAGLRDQMEQSAKLALAASQTGLYSRALALATLEHLQGQKVLTMHDVAVIKMRANQMVDHKPPPTDSN